LSIPARTFWSFPESTTRLHVALIVENEWLARYPRPLRCIYDNGGEFTGAPFQVMLLENGIQGVPTTVKNPQSNAINERIHQTVANILRTYVHTRVLNNADQAAIVMDTALATASHAVRCAVNRSIGNSPGSVVFQRDMFLPIQVVADLDAMRERRQLRIDNNLVRENRRRTFRDYEVGDQVLVVDRDHNRRKLAPTTEGPYIISQVFVNGTVLIMRRANVYERINIRRLRPFFAPA
jgi:hypothetical protein